MLDKIDANSLKASNGFSGLTVGEMIAYLEKLDPMAPVLVPAENGGLEEIVLVTARGVRLNVNHADGFGPHEVPAFGESAGHRCGAHSVGEWPRARRCLKAAARGRLRASA